MSNINNKSKELKEKLKQIKMNSSNKDASNLAINLNSKLGKIFIHSSTNNKYELVLVTNIYSTKNDFIPTAVYIDTISKIVWSRPVSQFVSKFKEEL